VELIQGGRKTKTSLTLVKKKQGNFFYRIFGSKKEPRGSLGRGEGKRSRKLPLSKAGGGKGGGFEVGPAEKGIGSFGVLSRVHGGRKPE